MNNQFQKNNLKLLFSFEANNSKENVFGSLELRFGETRLSNANSENLGFFYVDCESFLNQLQNEKKISNPLFSLSNNDILEAYTDWLNHEINEPETEKVQLFDRNYFKFGSPFTSYFFDERMITYNYDENFIHFKHWEKKKPLEIIDSILEIETVTSCLQYFLDSFDVEMKKYQ